MVTKNVKYCDVYGTSKDIVRFRVTIEQLSDTGEMDLQIPPEVKEIDLSPRGRLRLGSFVDRGTSKPETAPKAPEKEESNEG